MATTPKAVVLLSGGLDSTTTLAIARHEGFACHALTMQYGQRHAIELEAARTIAKALGTIEHVVLPIDLRSFLVAQAGAIGSCQPRRMATNRSPKQSSAPTPAAAPEGRNSK